MADEGEGAVRSLNWSAQYKLVHGAHEKRLQGDKIVLPPSALEGLISTASSRTSNATYVVSNGTQSDFDYARSDQQQSLPHPLMFRLVNPQNGNVAYCGVREFSANEGEIELSYFLQNALDIKSAEDDTHMSGITQLTVHSRSLPKGKFVRFRPLEAGYDPEDWKALLEKHMRNNFTVLNVGQTFTIPSGKGEYQFLIDEISPSGEGICIVDTDLEVDIEPLNEEQARESLRRLQAKSQRMEGSSTGGEITTETRHDGHVLSGAYVDYTVKIWDRDKDIEVILDTDDTTNVDIYVTPFGPRQRSKPRIDEHLFEDISDRPTKRICIRPTNVELEGIEHIQISVNRYALPGEENNKTSNYALNIRQLAGKIEQDNPASNSDSPPDPGDIRCKNCGQWAPGARFFLHENFCLRNNVRCEKCNQVFQRSSDEWKEHWHCEHDDSFGNGERSKQKHDRLLHQPTVCKACGGEFSNMMAVAQHRTTGCPSKEILCQFCHLLVPQKGLDDPDFGDPEVLLSGLTPHELTDGARTTECHMCNKIVRFRDMAVHLKHHDLERLSRSTPRLCRNANCGRTLDGVGANGQIKPQKTSRNDIGLCDVCFGPLYNSVYDPEYKALKRRLERKYLTQLVTGCGQSFCCNEFCKNGRFHTGMMEPGQSVGSKDALLMSKKDLDCMLKLETPLHLCTDEASQKRRNLADMIAAESEENPRGGGYSLNWSIAALEAENGDLGRARTWLSNWAPTRAEESGR